MHNNFIILIRVINIVESQKYHISLVGWFVKVSFCEHAHALHTERDY